MDFKELETYSKFIIKPTNGDSRHSYYYLLMKVADDKAVRLFDQKEAIISGETKVLRVKGG